MYITVQYIDALLFVFEVVLFWEGGGCMEVVCLFGFCSLGFEVVWEGGGLHPEKPPSYFLHYPSKSRHLLILTAIPHRIYEVFGYKVNEFYFDLTAYMF